MYNENLKGELKNAIVIAFGMVLMAIGLNVFFVPADVFTTGTLGFAQELATILTSLTGIPDATSLIYWLLNVPIILLGWFKVGKKFTLRTFFAITMLSVFTAVIPIPTSAAVTDPLLAIVTGSLLMGLGVGLCLKIGASSGGTDIIALYISLVLGKSFGMFNLLINAIVIIIAYFLTGDLTTCILMMVSIYTISAVVDKIYNSQEKRSLFIVTKKYELVRSEMLANHVRGLTIIDSEGGLTRESSKTIMVTIEQGELFSVLDTIKNADPSAFINVYKSESLVGNFENNYKKML